MAYAILNENHKVPKWHLSIKNEFSKDPNFGLKSFYEDILRIDSDQIHLKQSTFGDEKDPILTQMIKRYIEVISTYTNAHANVSTFSIQHLKLLTPGEKPSFTEVSICFIITEVSMK